MASALALALALTAPAEPVALDDLIVFADRSRCEPAAPFGRVVDQLRAMRSGTRTPLIEAVPPPYRPAFGGIIASVGNTGGALIRVRMNATWHGLPLLFLTVSSAPEQPGVKLALHVGASAARTRGALRPLGFRFGAYDAVPDLPVGLAMHEPVSTELSCTLRHG